jgi:hypothetical protein
VSYEAWTSFASEPHPEIITFSIEENSLPCPLIEFRRRTSRLAVYSRGTYEIAFSSDTISFVKYHIYWLFLDSNSK